MVRYDEVMTLTESGSRAPGGPLEFSVDEVLDRAIEVLDRAIEVFRDRGYEGSSVADIERGTGLNKSSIYNTFGSRHCRNVLNQRLSHLVDQGALDRIQYSEHPPRFDYVLTEQGRDLWPVLVALQQWGDRWRAPAGPPLQLVHRECGHVAELVPVCSHCSEPVTAGNVTVVRGPGADVSRPTAVEISNAS